MEKTSKKLQYNFTDKSLNQDIPAPAAKFFMTGSFCNIYENVVEDGIVGEHRQLRIKKQLPECNCFEKNTHGKRSKNIRSRTSRYGW